MSKQQFQADGLWWHTSLLRSIDRNSTQPQKVRPNKWVYLMTYQAKLIEEGSWCILLQNLSTISMHISKHGNRSKCGNRSNKRSMSLSDDLSSQTHWGRFVTHSSAEPFQHRNKIRIHRETTRNEIFRSRSRRIRVHSFNPQLTYRVKTQGKHHVTQSNEMIQRL